MAVVGADPGDVVTAMASEFAAEPDVVTVFGRLDDWSLVETVWPIAVPPGSQGRLAISGAGAPAPGLAARLASELTATVIAPRADALLVPGGSIFAVDGWLRYDASGSTNSAGRRTPAPEWESDVDTAVAAPDGLVVLPVPAGLWIFPDLPGAPPPGLDDLAYSVPLHGRRPVLLVGRPGFPAPPEGAIVAVARALPPPLRRRLVLAPYGPVPDLPAAAARLAREAGHSVTVATGVPVLAAAAGLVSLAIDETAAGGWMPLATTLTFPPSAPARPSGPVRGLDGYPQLDEHVFQLDERWVAEVTQSGLWVRPPRRETGADLVRGHPWTPASVRVFVGLPGDPPGPSVLPLLGALLARLPAATGMRVRLVPEPFAAAALPPPAGGTPMELDVRRAIVLDPSVAAPAAQQVTRPPAVLARPTEVSAASAEPANAQTAILPRPAVAPALPGSAARRPEPEPPAPVPGKHRIRVRGRWAPVTAAAAVLTVATTAAYALGRTPAPTPPPPAAQAPQAAAPQASSTLDPGTPLALPTEATASPQAGPSSTLGTVAAAGSAGAAGTPRPAAPTTTSAVPSGRPTTAKPPQAPTELPGLVNTSGRNLALDGTATASTVERSGALGAANTVDGDPATRWASEHVSDPQWLTVDLGAVWQVSQVRLHWQSSYATGYRVDLSTDGVTWQTVYRTSQGSGGVNQVAVPKTPARFVRMMGTARASARYGYSLWELEVR
ncbi:hypothetical protein GCM10022251_75630 [Phytohabitans flavus]|uniref:F5/8 type C domain-containing protein n=1 Tax=Phytohabitans flavus TaxID=1076124 RepID=A0A6F8XMI1_9ACTN|nr:hypothetical protein Pflav_014080 [Phytohabitans flavus]